MELKYKNIEMLDIIGEFGSNYWKYATSTTDNYGNSLYSIKKVQKLYSKENDIKQYEFEINILKKLNHSNIISLYDIYESIDELCIIYEYCDGTDLFELIVEKGAINELKAKKIFKEIIYGLEYIHSFGIIHKNIKPESIWFKYKYNPLKEHECIIFNFELASLDGNNTYYDDISSSISITYIAPEIINKKQYDISCDMWSVGCLLFTMLTEQPPFYDENENYDELCKQIKNCQYDMTSPEWDDISFYAKDLIEKLIQIEPNQRLSAKQTLKHQWLNN